MVMAAESTLVLVTVVDSVATPVLVTDAPSVLVAVVVVDYVFSSSTADVCVAVVDVVMVSIVLVVPVRVISVEAVPGEATGGVTDGAGALSVETQPQAVEMRERAALHGAAKVGNGAVNSPVMN